MDIDDDELEFDEFLDSLGDQDEGVIRALLLREFRDIVADRATLNRQGGAPLATGAIADIVEIDMQHADIEELVFALLTFGFDTSINMDPNAPEGSSDRVWVEVTPNGRDFSHHIQS